MRFTLPRLTLYLCELHPECRGVGLGPDRPLRLLRGARFGSAQRGV